MSKRLVWVDSVVMGIVLVFVGLAVSLTTVGVGFPLYTGPLALGGVFVIVGVWLTWKGLETRPHDSAKALEN